MDAVSRGLRVGLVAVLVFAVSPRSLNGQDAPTDDREAGETLEEGPLPHVAGKCRVGFEVEKGRLRVAVEADERVDGAMVLTYLAESPRMVFKRFAITDNVRIIHSLPLDLDLTDFYRLEIYEQQGDKRDEMALVRAFLIAASATE
jgi:hypothetical protein